MLISLIVAATALLLVHITYLACLIPICRPLSASLALITPT